jgi:predicted nucleic acid-binding protein
MILVDTSVVIDFARGKDAKLIAHLPTLSVAICGIARAELLCGARDAKHRADLLTLLATFNRLAIPDSIWDMVGDNLAALRLRSKYPGGSTRTRRSADRQASQGAICCPHRFWNATQYCS